MKVSSLTFIFLIFFLCLTVILKVLGIENIELRYAIAFSLVFISFEYLKEILNSSENENDKMKKMELLVFGVCANIIDSLSKDPNNLEFCQEVSIKLVKLFASCYGSHPNSDEFKKAFKGAELLLIELKARQV